MTTTVADENWCGSTDGEIFHGEYVSREDAVEAFPDEYNVDPGATFSTGRAKPFEPDLDLAYDVIDRLRDLAYERVGEVAEGWMETVTKEEYADLNKRLRETIRPWLEAHGFLPRFFEVVDVKKHVAEPRGDQ